MTRKFLVALLIGVPALALAGSLALWAFLSSWVPIHGKAAVIRALEHDRPIVVQIGAMRYDAFRGFILSETEVRRRETGALLARAPLIEVRVNWFLLPARRVAASGRAAVESPFETSVDFSGVHHLRDKSLAIDAETTPIPVPSLRPALAKFLPAGLTEGALRLEVQWRQPPQGGGSPALAGRVLGTDLHWAHEATRIAGDVTVEGLASPPTQPGEPWAYEARALILRAGADGLPAIGSLTGVEGRALLLPDRVEIEALTGRALGSSWTLQGTVGLEGMPTIEAMVVGPADLAQVVAAAPAIAASWQPEGVAQVQAVCRGPLHPQLLLDCQARATLQNATLAGAKLASPITQISGPLFYDAMARRVVIERLEGRLDGQPVALDGTVALGDRPGLDLHIAGTIPLAAARPWLTGDNVTRLDGVAAVDVSVLGTWPNVIYTGTVGLEEVQAGVARPALLIEHLSGTAELSPGRIEITEATMRLNDQPFTMRGWVEPGESPRVNASVRFPQGELWGAVRFEPARIVIEESRLTLGGSSVDVRGSVMPGGTVASNLEGAGTVDLTELTSLPFLPLPALRAWKLHGRADVQWRYQGPAADWRNASMQLQLRSPAMAIKDVPLEEVVCAIEQQRGLIQVRVPSALMAGGRTALELDAQRQPNGADAFSFKADVVGLQLERLARAIPAWRERQVRGAASTHIKLWGTWQDREGWLGEGWLNGEGEGLGEIPLLQNVLRGIFGALASGAGLDSLRRAQITQASLRWRLARGRISTEDLRLGGMAGAEPVALYARGSVGFDTTLDFTIEPALAERLLEEKPSLAGTVLRAAGQVDQFRRLIGRHRLTGTIKNPNYDFEVGAGGPATLLDDLFNAIR
jgi:hypothetical protein